MHCTRGMNRPCQIERRILADLPRPLRAPHDRGEIVLHTQGNVHGAALFDTEGDLKQIMSIEFSNGALADQGEDMGAQPTHDGLGVSLRPAAGHFGVPLQGDGFKKQRSSLSR
ncbi:hypothetical protein D3C72_1389720 [compost metagenome]